MTYKTLLVHTQPGQDNSRLLRIAADLAARFDAGLIGVAMCQPVRIIYSEGYVPTDIIQQDREQRERELAEAAAEFHRVLSGGAKIVDWRGEITEEELSDHLARQARGADLIITGMDRDQSIFDASRHLDLGALVMRAGRPVLIVPDKAVRLNFERVLIGWRDTREARRAVADALPILRRSKRVLLTEIAAPEDLPDVNARLADVAAFLARHEVAAEPIAAPAIGDAAGRLHALAAYHEADLIVAGAYGHSRVREWVLGGVTRDLLLRAEIPALISH